MGTTVKGLIPEAVIRAWLVNYQDLIAGSKPADAVPTNSGPKPQDGITSHQLNRIMLEAAIEALPMPHKAIVKGRWILQLRQDQTLATTAKLGHRLSKKQYYKRCDQAITLIYYHVNGKAANYQDLIQTLEGKK